jgi:hypothetical protein
MMPPGFPMLLAEETSRTVFEFGRYQSNLDLILPLAAFVAMVVFVRLMYVRDCADLGRAFSWLLTGLRTAVLLGLLLVYLQPQLRTEREIIRNSRVVVLVDTSLSMAHNDHESPSVPSVGSRAQEIQAALADSSLLNRLRDTHEVVIGRFDVETSRVIELGKSDPEVLAASDQNPGGDTASSDTASSDPDTSSADSNSADANDADSDSVEPGVDGPSQNDPRQIDWATLLEPRGPETRLGATLRQWMIDERSAPLAGLIVISDGGQNAGIGPQAAIKLAREADVPIYTIGIGSADQPINARIVDLVAPARAYPSDQFVVEATVQAQRVTDPSLVVELYSQEATAPDTPADGAEPQLEDSQQVTLEESGKILPVRFEMTPDELGGRILTLRLKVPEGDTNPADNQETTYVEIVDHKSRVLLMAGGPGREYRFLRSMLFRDDTTQVDVLLQTAQEGISQDADEVLDQFPSMSAELYEYDAIVAVDPDWAALGADQIDLLERWVAEQAGGLVVIAGPIHTKRWIQEPRASKIRNLYPVEFRRHTTLPLDAQYGATEPWPIEFTPEGIQADFLHLEDSPVMSQRAWATFEGVYGFFDVAGPKPAATVYGRFGDPTAGDSEGQPLFLAGQIYGSGRVFYLASAEMWRLRGLEEAYFDRFYTKLIRHVSQRRLLRGSTRGAIFVEDNAPSYDLGQTISLHAQLTDAQYNPLDTTGVEVQMLLPDRSIENVMLRPNVTRLGSYTGQFAARQQGTYRVELPVPESDEVLSLSIRVNVPNLESENLQRNDPLLARIADETSGQYYVGLDAALTPNEAPAVVAQLRDASETLPLTDTPHPLWDNQWVMLGLCGVLCVEWLLRRLARLA